MPPKPGHLVRDLHRLRLEFGPSVANRKTALLKKLIRARIARPTELIAYHDLLCFLRAFPDNLKMLTLVERELKQFGSRVKYYREMTRDKKAKKLADSGIVDTVTTHPFSLTLVNHLIRWHADKLEIDWITSEDESADKLFPLLPLLVSWLENDTLDNDEELDTLQWLRCSSGRKSSDLRSVIGLLDATGWPPNLRRHFYDGLEYEVSWDLRKSNASRSLKRVVSGRKFYQKEPLLGRSGDLRVRLAEKPSPLRKASAKEGEVYVRAISEMLAVRNRELFPLTHADPAEVYVNEPGRGLKIVVFGTAPEIRLPLEGNFGAMLVRNGMPIGYGVGATLFDRVETAINIFPAFRSGESAFTIEQFFRLFYHHFGSRVLLVRSNQMGDGEEEALHSGAFWFYNKLGFRAVRGQVRDLAEKERAKMRQEPKYRVPLSKMKRLAKSDVFFHADPALMDAWKEMSLINLGKIVSDFFATRFDGDRSRGTEESVSDLCKILSIGNLKSWTTDERVSLERLAPLILSIPDLRRWTESEKSDMADVIRAKGSVRERGYVHLSNRHPRFQRALEKMAGNYVRHSHL